MFMILVISWDFCLNPHTLVGKIVENHDTLSKKVDNEGISNKTLIMVRTFIAFGS